MVRRTLFTIMAISTWCFTAPAAAAAAPNPQPAKPLSRTQFIANLDQNYRKLDANGDGSLVRAELEAAQGRQVQAADAALTKRRQDAFAKLDTDRNGALSPAEFAAATPVPKRSADAVGASLARLDTSKDGQVSLTEYRAPMLANFDKLDTNKDGTVTPAEQAAGRKR